MKGKKGKKKEKLLEIFNLIFGKTVSEDIKKDGDDWDSLKHIEILSAVGEEFNIKFTPDDINKLTSFKDILEAVEKC